MDVFSAQIWQRFRRSLTGRLFASALIAAPFGTFAAAEVSPTLPVIVLGTLGASLIGVIAVCLLEFRDRRRNRSTEWQQGVADTTTQVRELFPDISPGQASEVAKAVEESRFTPLVWAGMALGGFSLVCGAAMLIARLIEFFRAA